ncbi:hypothetical protein PV409_38090 [Streptomyces sp. ME02-6979.5a]|nr:hypothetical protein [Streptomyces sp. ME02-6979.5a]MDX3343764.1 hypothetical protein [Streptomyces sp. ME02-6979.5a]
MPLAPVPQAFGAGSGPVLRHLVADGARTGVGEMARHKRGDGR